MLPRIWWLARRQVVHSGALAISGYVRPSPAPLRLAQLADHRRTPLGRWRRVEAKSRRSHWPARQAGEKRYVYHRCSSRTWRQSRWRKPLCASLPAARRSAAYCGPPLVAGERTPHSGRSVRKDRRQRVKSPRASSRSTRPPPGHSGRSRGLGPRLRDLSCRCAERHSVSRGCPTFGLSRPTSRRCRSR